MKFSFPPSGRGGYPVFNFRSEGRRFDKSHRCLIPASAFFEFTGKKYPKTKHRFTLTGAPFRAIAGLWQDGKGNQPPGFAMLTTEPGPDVAPYHDDQVVVLPLEDWSAWIRLTKPVSELSRPLPAQSLAVETVRRGITATTASLRPSTYHYFGSQLFFFGRNRKSKRRMTSPTTRTSPRPSRALRGSLDPSSKAEWMAVIRSGGRNFPISSAKAVSR